MKPLVSAAPGKQAYSIGAKPSLQKDQAIIKIKRIGICGTGLHAFGGRPLYFNYQRILGHELCGELIAVDNVPGFNEGEVVTFIPYFNCGNCISCRRGKPNCCVQIKVCGVPIDGDWWNTFPFHPTHC